MTKELFLTDSHARMCLARVVELAGPLGVVLDQTVLYPQGGGQPNDTGKLLRNSEEFRVTGVKRMDGKIVHFADKAGLSVGDVVSVEVDWVRRYALMRMHTAAHVLARVLSLETGALISGNQLDTVQSRMDFSARDFDKEAWKSFEKKTNEVLARDLMVSVSFEKFEEAMKRPELFRLKNVLPKNLSVLRIVSIGDFDSQADGGTHVARTSEVGRISILKMENKGAQNRRIYWTLES